MRKLAIRHALLRRATRMAGMQKMEGRHAKPEASLPVSKCSLILCVSVPGLLRKAHPNDRGGGSWPPICAEKADLPGRVCPPVFS